MDTAIYILILYLIGLGLMLIYLGWFIAFKLDSYAWKYTKYKIWVSFFVHTLLWPLILIRPKYYLDPIILLEGKHSDAASMREEDNFWTSLPRCGAQIHYRQHSGISPEDVHGEFIFRSADIEGALLEATQCNPLLNARQEGEMLNWVQERDDTITKRIYVPDRWWDFQRIANSLIRDGHGDAACLKCLKPIPKNQLLHNDDHHVNGWNYERLVCPNGHKLLVVEKYRWPIIFNRRR